MSDLQDALDRYGWDFDFRAIPPGPVDIDIVARQAVTILDAARKYANPNRKAAITALLQWSHDAAEGMAIPDNGVDDILFAALGITPEDIEDEGLRALQQASAEMWE